MANASRLRATDSQARGLRYSMIGEGKHSTNQRRHNYVQENVEVGFFTDPTVCIGCKACEVACKEWNEVPDDGFIWSGNSYDNTGHLGASTWRHVMFLEQDRQKGGQRGGFSRTSLGNSEEDPFHSVFSFRCFQSVCGREEPVPRSVSNGSIVRTRSRFSLVQNNFCNRLRILRSLLSIQHD